MCGEQAKEELGACCLYIVIEWAREHLPEWLSHSHTSSTLAKGEEDEAEQHVRQPLQAGHDDEDKVSDLLCNAILSIVFDISQMCIS